MKYQREQELVAEFVSSATAEVVDSWGPLQVTTEFYYMRGRTDVVALTINRKVIAFEMKLKKWKEALHQAYRNTCFAHLSYVVVPEEVVELAIRCADEFHKRSVGICYLSEGKVVIALEARESAPLQSWLTQRAEDAVQRNDEHGTRQ